MHMSWRKAIERVLQEEARPMHYSEISEQALARGYYQTDGVTPDATVNAEITTSINRDGDASPFVKVGRGIYALKNITSPTHGASTSHSLGPPTETSKPHADWLPVAAEPDMDESVIRCLGMYWQRDLVVWKNDPRIFGKQQAQSKPIDFGGQRGIYILYDQHTVVYVGRSVDRPLGKRLYEHTSDRLGGRWTRFSWFGLLDVTDDGNLVEIPLKVSSSSLIAMFEAILIEALEPPQNRKRGDDFSMKEYIQDLDPELREREIRNTLRTIEQKLRGQG